MKIQLTYETKMLLDNGGGFLCEPRGQVGHIGTNVCNRSTMLSNIAKCEQFGHFAEFLVRGLASYSIHMTATWV